MTQIIRFISVAEHKSFTLAANALYTHQSTISKNIAQLEQEIGLSLFDRNTNTLELTYAGKSFYEKSLTVVADFNKLEDTIKNIRTGQQGSIKVTCIGPYLPFLLKALNQFKLQYPNIEFVFTNSSFENIPNIFQSLNSEEADIATLFSIFLPEEHDDYEVIPFLTEHFRFLLSKNHPLAKKEKITLQEMKNIKVLKGVHVPTWVIELINNELRNKLNAPPLIVEPCYSPTSADSLLMQLMNEEYVTVAPKTISERSGHELCYSEIDNIDTSFNVLLVYKKNSTNSSLRLFIDEFISLQNSLSSV